MVSRKTMSSQLPPKHTVNVDVAVDPVEPVKIVRTRLSEADTLTVQDDLDTGGDPYNSTGQFFVPAIKKQAGN